MTTIGYGDKAPITFFGRAIAMLWMLIAMGLTASLTAAIVSAVNFEDTGPITIPEGLQGKRVGAIADTTAAAVLDRSGVAFEPVETPLAGLQAVSQDRIGAFVHSAPVLRYVASQNDDLEVTIAATRLDPQLVSFAVAENSPLREPLNRVLLAAIAGESWNAIIERYLPVDEE